MAMSPRARQAFLLRNVEGFNVPEVAEIMRLDPNRATALLERGAQRYRAGPRHPDFHHRRRAGDRDGA